MGVSGRILPLVLLAACGGDAARLERARALWEEEGSTAYTMTVQHLCLCPDTSPVEVEVAGGEVFSAIWSGVVLEPSEYLDWFTVDGLFDEVAAAIAGEPDGLEVDYDPDSGYPRAIEVDPDQLAQDDDLSWFVTRMRLDPDG